MRQTLIILVFLLLGASLMPIPGQAVENTKTTTENTKATNTIVNTYEIGPGDVLEISVWKDESLTKQLVVPPDGVISFPLVGDIKVTEMTVPQLRQEIAKRLNDYVPDATVTVMLM